MSTPAAAVSPTPQPLRIKSIALTDFRAFPGSTPPFVLDSKNLLIYGENSSGKSSLFHALREFFSLNPRKLAGFKNRFSGQPDTACRVEVTFNDAVAPAGWELHAVPGTTPPKTVERHPASATGGSDSRVTAAALRSACLDYRSLLDTNYKQGDNEINLFEIAVKHLLHDYQVVIAGGTTNTVGELWRAVGTAMPHKHSATAIQRINDACAAFNGGMKQALSALPPLIEKLLADLTCSDVAVGPFSFAGVTYQPGHFRRDRKLLGQELKLGVSFRAQALPVPQLFLNEARLSALALAIYLSGRLAYVPAAPSGELKLLVLDDVLIGLDHSNRLPVLEVLRKHFADWQIVLLTHDRVWFEMARMYLQSGHQWSYAELYEGKDVTTGIPVPLLRKANDNAAKGCLEQAQTFLDDHHIPAAANYARAAFELALRRFCQRYKVPVPFRLDPHRLDTEELMSSVEAWLKANAKHEPLKPVLERVKLFRKVVLNPYSHAAPPTIVRAEVEGAIKSVDELNNVLL